jgi:hypothetical protein
VRLVDQWEAIEAGLPTGWDDVRLTLTTEQPGELARAAQVLGPMNAGRVGESLVLHVRRAGGPAGPEAARRLFGRLDGDRVWCRLTAGDVTAPPPEDARDAASSAAAGGTAEGLAARWDACLSELPHDWSDLLCELEIESSDLLPRAALLCAPINPTRDRSRVGFTFRCARLAGYGVSPAMARRCFERLDDEPIAGRVAVLRVLADTHNVATQGAVWLVDGRML